MVVNVDIHLHQLITVLLSHFHFFRHGLLDIAIVTLIVQFLNV